MINELIKILNAQDDFVGMSTTEDELTITLKDKTVVIVDYTEKTVDEIIKEINEKE